MGFFRLHVRRANGRNENFISELFFLLFFHVYSLSLSLGLWLSRVTTMKTRMQISYVNFHIRARAIIIARKREKLIQFIPAIFANPADRRRAYQPALILFRLIPQQNYARTRSRHAHGIHEVNL